MAFSIVVKYYDKSHDLEIGHTERIPRAVPRLEMVAVSSRLCADHKDEIIIPTDASSFQRGTN